MARHAYIDSLSSSQMISGIYAMQNCQLGLTKSGKPFIKCLIADKSGRVPGRMWNASEELFEMLPTDGFVRLEAQTQPYQGEMQVIIQHIEPAEPDEEHMLELLPSTNRDIGAMFEQLFRIMRSTKSPQILALVEAYASDDELMSNFRRAPAAMVLHHAYLGGLLEHTLNLITLAEAILPNYPLVNRDIVLMGLFLHDLGKCNELVWDSGFSYSDEGQLVGHIARGVVWLNDKARECGNSNTPIEPELLHVLEHIILSHHGTHEFGSIKIPSTPEAVLIHQLDNLDAKMEMVLAAAKREAGTGSALGGDFTEKIWALNTRIYRPDPLAHEKKQQTAVDGLKDKFSDPNDEQAGEGGLF
jgi:3'-5' exoribonuclease